MGRSGVEAECLRETTVDVGGDGFEVLDCDFREGNQCNIIEGIVPLPAHAVEEREGWRQSRVEMLPGEVDDGNVMQIGRIRCDGSNNGQKGFRLYFAVSTSLEPERHGPEW